MGLATARDVAERYRVKLPTVRAWVRLTDIPVIRLGRLTRFEIEEVDAWIRRGGASLARRQLTEPKV